MAGLDVLLLEKTTFPREKVCGDGLTPRAVRELITLGIPHPEDDGWVRNKGLRIIGGGLTLALDWPETSEFPPYGLVRTRMDFDDILARHAREARRPPPRGHQRHRTGARRLGPDRRRHRREPSTRTAAAPVRSSPTEPPLVVAADGNSSRLAALDGPARSATTAPMGVAVRTYYTSPRTNDDYLESWLELWVDDPKNPGERVLLPGYGWVFGVGDGTSNLGLGILNTSKAFGNVDYKDVMRRWVATMPEEWTYNDETMVGPIRGAALPMGFNRQPHYADGLLLVGDAGGMVNPFNGEGIAYAMESGRLGGGGRRAGLRATRRRRA